jgi:hypothetical protein
LITAPDVFRGGVEEKISVTILGYEEVIRVNIKLQLSGNIISTASADIQNRGTISILTPPDVKGKGLLRNGQNHFI